MLSINEYIEEKKLVSKGLKSFNPLYIKQLKTAQKNRKTELKKRTSAVEKLKSLQLKKIALKQRPRLVGAINQKGDIRSYNRKVRKLEREKQKEPKLFGKRKFWDKLEKKIATHKKAGETMDRFHKSIYK